MERKFLFLLAGAGLLLLAALMAVWLVNRADDATMQNLAHSALPKPTPIPGAKEIFVREALEMPNLRMAFTGNGHNRVVSEISSELREPVVIRFPAGTVLETQDIKSRVAFATAGFVNVPARGTVREALSVVALSAKNRIYDNQPHRIARVQIPDLLPLLEHLDRHPEFSLPSTQTAVLAVMENLPLSVFAKFPMASGGKISGVESEAFRVEVPNLIGALQLLRKSGYPMDRIALTVDPQLVVESMVDPLTRSEAMDYYGIGREHEWAFWRELLLNGPENLRHYALHGIARFYPETGLDMLPDWAREGSLGLIFQKTAIYGLAETRRPEALSILSQLQVEFRDDPILSDAVARSIGFLNRSLMPPAMDSEVPFRLTAVEPRPLLEEDKALPR